MSAELVTDFVEVVRRAGRRVSSAEVIDAVGAAALTGYESKEDLRACLTAALVKRAEDHARFDRAFDAFFRADAQAHGSLEMLGLRASEREVLEQRLAALAGPRSGAAIAAGGGELDALVEEALRDAGVEGMQSPMQIGLTAARAARAMGLPAIERALPELRAELGDAIGDRIAARLEAIARRLRARARESFEQRNPDRLEQARAARLETAPFGALERAELDQVAAEVRRLGRLLRDRLARRRRRTRRGTLDVRATLRASARTEGVPMRLLWRRRRRERPRLVVLCDVSDSVRAAARFFLVLVHAIASAFSRTRSFLFVRDVGEATELFATHPIEQAIELAYGGTAVTVGASSDYGRSLRQLAQRHLDAFDRRTTLIVLGDARSNYLDPGLDALRLLRQRSLRIVWLNPEPVLSWGFGDSAMLQYRPLCTLAAPVATLAQLREAVERLAERLSRPS